MSTDEMQRAALLALLGQRLAGEQTNKMVLFQQAIADRLGLASTDLIGLAALNGTEPLTAGQLAEATGLTTGSITVMIDRLEKAGYVQREKDPGDRRRVIVQPIRARIDQEITPLYAALAEGWKRTLAGYSTQELATLLDAQTRGAVLLQEQTATLRLAGAQDSAPAGAVRAADPATTPQPQHARLLFANGAHKVMLRGAPLAALYQAQFEPPAPQIQLQGNTVQLRYQRFSLLSWKGSTGKLSLSTAATWQIDLRSGALGCNFDLRNLLITALSVVNGAHQLELNLGPARGRVPIRITGGATELTIQRPAGVAMQLQISGGATHIRLDEHYEQVVSAEMRWQTPGFDAATDGYVVTVEGGAVNVNSMSADPQ